MLKFRKRTLVLFTATAIAVSGGGFALSAAQAGNNSQGHGKALGRASATPTSTATPAPTATSTATPTPTVTPTATSTPTASTPTATATTTPTPTPTATTTPTPVPTAGGALASTGTEAAQVLGWGSVKAGDEFNYAGAPDSTKWSVYNSAGHAGNGLRVPQAITVNNGMMTITGKPDGTTGGMSAKFARQQYGKYEVRMRTSAADPTYHAVAILWPDGPSAKCSEIDFAEQTNDLANISFFLHYGCASGVQTYAKKPLDMTQWHNYAVEWCPSGIKGYVDGQLWFSDSDPAHQPDGPMHLTLQLDWFPKSGATTQQSTMDVDWARHYQC
ncbi:glycoside hydrolase family 16 protein [Arthrobacter sp. ISL-30]|nr:glycoside hydrolase family 16 protein [Arthrobacter sp. ISL-30]